MTAQNEDPVRKPFVVAYVHPGSPKLSLYVSATVSDLRLRTSFGMKPFLVPLLLSLLCY